MPLAMKTQHKEDPKEEKKKKKKKTSPSVISMALRIKPQTHARLLYGDLAHLDLPQAHPLIHFIVVTQFPSLLFNTPNSFPPLGLCAYPCSSHWLIHITVRILWGVAEMSPSEKPSLIP